MNTFNKFLLFIAIFLLLTALNSCIAIQPNNIKNTALHADDLNAINGFYSNTPNTKNKDYNASLWKQLNYLKKDTLEKWQNHKVELEVINRKKIRAKLWLNEAVISEKILKGKVKNDYFSVKRNLKVFGIPFIYFSVKDYKMEIGIDNNKQLLLNSAHMQSLNILIMSGGNSNQFSNKYQLNK